MFIPDEAPGITVQLTGPLQPRARCSGAIKLLGLKTLPPALQMEVTSTPASTELFCHFPAGVAMNSCPSLVKTPKKMHLGKTGLTQ